MKRILEIKTIKNILITLAFPVGMIMLMGIILALAGKNITISMLDIKDLIRNTGTSSIIAFALSFNLTSGRLDLSLGAQRLVGTIFGGNLALALGLSGIWLLAFSLAVGFFFGFIVGLIFVSVRIPALVLGIGMGLVLESVAYVGSGGFGLNLFGVEGIGFLSEINFTILIVSIIALFTYGLVNYTKFGYHMKAIQGSQRIAQNSGIKVFKHAVISYSLAGAFVGISGILESAYRTQLESSLGFVSNGPVLGNIFPMSLGLYIGKWSNQAVGIVIGTLTLKIFSVALGRLEFSSAMTSVINMILFIAFLVYRANEDYFKDRFAIKNRIKLARQTRKDYAIAQSV